mgnify:CR=1 FL=1
MKQTVLDVLVYLFENCAEEDQREVDHSALRGKLIEAGFADAQISKAFDWLEALAKQREAGGSSAARNLAVLVSSKDSKISSRSPCFSTKTSPSLVVQCVGVSFAEADKAAEKVKSMQLPALVLNF